MRKVLYIYFAVFRKLKFYKLLTIALILISSCGVYSQTLNLSATTTPPTCANGTNGTINVEVSGCPGPYTITSVPPLTFNNGIANNVSPGDYQISATSPEITDGPVFESKFYDPTQWQLNVLASGEGGSPNIWAIGSGGNSPYSGNECGGAPSNCLYITCLGLICNFAGGNNGANPIFYASAGSTTNRAAVTANNINTIGYTNLVLSFAYRCVGATTAYATVVYSIDGGTNWIELPTQYRNQASWTCTTVNLPVVCENIPNFRFGYRWRNGSSGEDPPMVIADVKIEGDGGSASPGCSGTTNVTVSNPEVPTFNLITSGPLSLCSGQSVTLSVPAGITNPVWSTGETTTSIVVTEQGTYSATGTNAQNCSAFSVTETVIITPLPDTPTLIPDPPCADAATTFTAGNGSLFEFTVNDISQGPFSSNNTFTSGLLEAGDEICVRSYPPVPFVMDGEINESEWQPPLATSAGGPTGSGFGPYNNIDGLFLKNQYGNLYGALAGNEVDGDDQINNNWILIFIDAKPGGFNRLSDWTNRDQVPGLGLGIRGVFNLALNDDVIFDPGFEPDYILTMNQANSEAFFDLYDMQANTNDFLGSNLSNPNDFGFIGNAGFGDLSRGFEFSFPLSKIGSPATKFSVFAMMVNDPNAGEQTFISNQFLTRANDGEGNYGNEYIDFGNAAPNPIDYYLSADCYSETCITVSPVIPPVTGFSYLSPVCENDPNILPIFDDNFVMGGNYNITPTNGLVIDPITREINLSSSTPGTYTISYTVPAIGCNPEGTSSFEIIINPLPTTTNIYHD
jgi:hypothetical protein